MGKLLKDSFVKFGRNERKFSFVSTFEYHRHNDDELYRNWRSYR